ncbi:MAG: ester cyclase [Chromatiales bacterium]|nr:ester cyclase [Chromatiales bacterium]
MSRWNAMLVLALAGYSLAAPACADSLATPELMDPSCRGHEQNRSTYLRELELVVNGGQMELVDELIAPEYVNHSGPPGSPQGPEAIRSYLKLLKGAFPDRKVKNEMLLCAGDYVIVRSTVTGMSTGPYFGRAPTGRTFSVTGTDIYLIRDGRFRGRWGNEDALGMMTQLGYMPAESR